MSGKKNRVILHDTMPPCSDFQTDVLNGLNQRPRTIAPKYFYDHPGSILFDRICELPEYYPTRTENRILQDYHTDITACIGESDVFIELGSGASRKIRTLLESIKPARYIGVDISRDFLLQSTQTLANHYSWLDVHAVHTDFTQSLNLPGDCLGKQNLVFYPGSSIGNFAHDEACDFLKQLHALIGTGGRLLIGVDLKKDPALLHAAYNDAQGVTAAFNLNLLYRITREMQTDLDPSRFTHEAFYNEAEERIEMHLVSTCNQVLHIAGQTFDFSLAESIHTENSYKYSIEEFQALAHSAGFEVVKTWCDNEQLFSEQLLYAA